MTDKTHPYGDDMSPEEISVLLARDSEAATAAAAASAASAGSGAGDAAGKGAGQEDGAKAAGTGGQESGAAGTEGEKKEGVDATGAADADKGGTQAAGDGDGAGSTEKPNADALAAVLEEADAVRHVTYQVGDIDSMKKARSTLLGKEDELNDKLDDIRKMFDDGELTEEAFKAQRAETRQAIRQVRDQSDELLRGITSQETLATANNQAALQSQTQVLAAISRASKEAGLVDYSTPKAQAQFDAQLQALLSDPDWAAKPFEEAAHKAHTIVCMLNGFNTQEAPPSQAAAATGGKTEPAATGAATTQAAREAPRTLAGVPPAAAAPVGSDIITQFNALSGDAAEDFLASLPASQRANLMRSTVVQ